MTPRPPIESAYRTPIPRHWASPLTGNQSASSTHFSPPPHGTLTTFLRDTARRS